MDEEMLEMEENVTRDSVLALVFEKEKIESEISQIKSVLDSVSVLMITNVMRVKMHLSSWAFV
jgi:hypothetical protein